MPDVRALARRAFLPESVALVVVGLAIGQLVPGVRDVISGELVLLVLVPGLVFDAAFDLDWAIVRTQLPALAGLAIPGVLLTAIAVALVLNGAIALPLTLGFVAGAIVSATDPIAVVATLERLRMPPRLRTLIEGESLFNDGTGLALFAIALAAATVGITSTNAAGLFVIVITLSCAAGHALGRFGTVLSRALAATPMAALLTSVAYSYACYALASGLGMSGVLVTVVSALTTGHLLRAGARQDIAEALDRGWGVIAFVLSAVAFLAIGAAIDVTRLAAELYVVAAGVLAVVLARAAFVYLPYVVLRRRPPLGWAHVLFWSGLRGAIAFAATLSLPADLPEREVVRDICFGIVLVTLIVQGATAPIVVRAALGRANS